MYYLVLLLLVIFCLLVYVKRLHVAMKMRLGEVQEQFAHKVRTHEALASEQTKLRMALDQLSKLPPADLLQKATELLADIYGFSFTWIDLLEGTQLTRHSGSGCAGENIDPNLGFDLSRMVLATHKTRLVKNPTGLGGFWATVFSLPLGSEQHGWGVLHLADRKDRSLSPTILEDLKLFANALVLAVDQQRAQELARFAQSERRALSSLFHDALVTIDGYGLITHVNTVFEDRFGYPAAELLGKNVSILIPPDEAANHDGYLERYRRTGDRHIIGVPREVAVVGRDGALHASELIVHETWVDGRVFFSGLLRDISERKAVEESLCEARNRMHAADLIRLQFMEQINHALRTPMSGIVGMADLLMETQLLPEQADYARSLIDASQSMIENLDGIMECSRLENNPSLIEHVAYDPRAILDEMAELLANRSPEKTHEVTVQHGENLPGIVEGDRDRLRHVLLHLAIHYFRSFEESELHIGADLLPVGNKARLRFWIRAGAGFLDPQAYQILSSESTAGPTTLQHEGYFNLQLARRLGGLIGGTFSYEHTDTETQVSFALDVSDPGPFCSKVLAKIRCLVVEPQYTTFLALASLLEPYGCQPEHVGGPDKALEKVQDAALAGKPYQVLILGWEHWPETIAGFAHVLAESLLYADTHVVLTCQLRNRRLVMPLLDDGVHACLTRPLKQKRLVEVCLNILKNAPRMAELLPLPVFGPASEYRKVLVVEDNEINQRLLIRVLENLKIPYRIANNGLDAVNAFNEEPFGLILMDLNMPLMDGIEATRRIREREAGKSHVPIVAMTAEMLKVNRSYCLAHGMDEYLLKPVRIPDLVNLIHRILSENPGLS